MDIYTEAKPLTIIKIFQESVKLLAKRTLTLPIFAIYISSSYILYYLNHHVLSPLIAHLTLTLIDLLINKARKLDFYVPIQKDITHIIIVESVFNLISFALSSIFTIATIHVLHEENLTFKDLILKMRQTIKGPFITKVYIGVFQTGYSSLMLSSFLFLFLIFFPHFKAVSFALSFAVQFLILLVLLSYLAVVWYVSIVVSVVEEGCYGLVAIGKAAKLIRGKRMQGTVIVFIELVVMVAFIVGYYKIMVDLSRYPGTQLVVGLVFIGLTSVASMIVLSTSMVFYCECMRLNGKNIEIAMEGNRVYKALSKSDVVDDVSSKYLIENKC